MAEAVLLATGLLVSFAPAALEVTAPPESTDAALKPAGAQAWCSHPPTQLSWDLSPSR